MYTLVALKLIHKQVMGLLTQRLSIYQGSQHYVYKVHTAPYKSKGLVGIFLSDEEDLDVKAV